MKENPDIYLPEELIQTLIVIGQAESFGPLEEAIKAYPHLKNGQIMRQRPEFWDTIASRLNDADVVNLIKSLAVAECSLPNFRSGSVSPVIFLFRHLTDRHFHGTNELADWIIRHSDNDYVPWGCSRHGAHSASEYHEFLRNRQMQRSKNEEFEKRRSAEARVKKAEKASRDLFHAVSHKDVKGIYGLRRKGGDVTYMSEQGKSPLDVARDLGDQRVLDALTGPIEPDHHE